MANKPIFGILMGIVTFLAGCEMLYLSVTIATSSSKPSSFVAYAVCEYITDKNTVIYSNCIGQQNPLMRLSMYNPDNIEHCIYNYVDEHREMHQCVLSNELDIDVGDDKSARLTPHCMLGLTKTVYPNKYNACNFAIPEQYEPFYALRIMFFVFSICLFGLSFLILHAEWKRSVNNERVFVPLTTIDV
jgi:hypothetical protein